MSPGNEAKFEQGYLNNSRDCESLVWSFVLRKGGTTQSRDWSIRPNGQSQMSFRLSYLGTVLYKPESLGWAGCVVRVFFLDEAI